MEHIIDQRQTVIVAILVLYIGKYLSAKVTTFR